MRTVLAASLLLSGSAVAGPVNQVVCNYSPNLPAPVPCRLATVGSPTISQVPAGWMYEVTDITLVGGNQAPYFRLVSVDTSTGAVAWELLVGAPQEGGHVALETWLPVMPGHHLEVRPASGVSPRVGWATIVGQATRL
jgi:hypothetical protein